MHLFFKKDKLRFQSHWWEFFGGRACGIVGLNYCVVVVFLVMPLPLKLSLVRKAFFQVASSSTVQKSVIPYLILDHTYQTSLQ
jgi:hypothetical protein